MFRNKRYCLNYVDRILYYLNQKILSSCKKLRNSNCLSVSQRTKIKHIPIFKKQPHLKENLGNRLLICVGFLALIIETLKECQIHAMNLA